MLSPAPLFSPANSIHLLEPRSGLGQSQRIVIQAALRRGIGVRMLGDKLYRLYDDVGHIDMTLGMSTLIPHVTRLQTNSKSIAKILMQESGMPVPEGQQFMPQDVEAAWSFARALLPVVVKPSVGAFSKNVTVRITTEAGFRAAFARAAQGRRFQVVVEAYIEGLDHRVLVVGDRVCGVVLRRYPSVVGNGADTVATLIDTSNDRRRDTVIDPLGPETMIPHKPGVHYDRFPELVDYTAVPDKGQRVFLRDDLFVAEAREMVDMTDIIHPGFCEFALKARDAFGPMPSFGLDLLASDITASPDSQRWGFCELNLNAAHSGHHLATEGTRRDTAGCILAELFPHATLEREAMAAMDGVSLSIAKTDKTTHTRTECAIALHSLTIDSHSADETRDHYTLSGKAFQVEGLRDWINRHCADEDVRWRG